jgi:4-aminobutyrate aminotransferase / (S)-3-amino-2-methylpropionate transaminase / 5-aminovalerate transaminase
MRRAHSIGTAADLLVRRNAAVPRGIANATPIFPAKAENAEIWDTEGRRYIDFAGGIGVLGTGHRHPRVIAAVSDQLARYTHAAFQVMAFEPYVELAERLNAIAPFQVPAKTLLLTTGAEAVENAVKIARIATGRSAVISFSGAFHGRTLLTLALTGKVAPYKGSMGALGGDVFRVPFPVEHRGVSVETTLRALDALFHGDVDIARVAAIIIEPVQGEGGFHIAPPSLLSALRELCDKHGILLIADEIQSGFGRTGRMFAIQHSGVEPDLVTLAKSLAGGFPLSAVVGRAAIMEKVEPGGLGGTYGGSPIGCAAALAVLDVIADERLLARAEVIGARMRMRLGSFMRRPDLVPLAQLRGLGAMLAFDVVKEGGSEPDGAAARRVVARAFEQGLVILTCGMDGETLRILLPLTAPDSVIDEGLDILESALARE